MGKLVVAVAGGLVGAAFGMPELGFLAGSLLGSALFPTNTRGGAKLTDLQVTASTYGQPIQMGWGTARVGGNVLWSKPLQQHKHSAGGKGGPSTYTYSWTGGVGICATDQTGPIDMILKIWADSKLVYDATGESGFSSSVPTDGGGKGGSGGNANNTTNGSQAPSAFNKLGNFTLYQGSQSQLPDPAEEAFFGAANCPGYRGMARVVFENVDVENYGERVPNWTFEVAFGAHASNQISRDYTFNDAIVAEPTPDIMVLDPIRHYGYFISEGVSGSSGIHVMDLQTGTEIKTVAYADIVGGSTFSDLTGSAMAIGQDGYLYLRASGMNYAPLYKIDPDSMSVIGQCGTTYSGFDPGHGEITDPDYMVTLTVGGSQMVLTVGLFGEIAVTNGSSMQPVNKIVGPGFNSMKMTPGEQLSDTYATAYGALLASDVITIYRFDVGTGGVSLATIGTIVPTDIASDWAHITSLASVIFDGTDGNLIFSVFNSTGSPVHRNYVCKFTGSAATPVWKTPTGYLPGNPDVGAAQSHVINGIYAFVDSSNKNVNIIDTATGALTTQVWTNVSAGFQAWDDGIGAIIMWGTLGGTDHGDYRTFTNQWGVLVVDKALGNAVPLSTIVTDICETAGMVSGDIDVSALTSINVEGYILQQQTSGKDAIVPLSQAFLFDATESDFVLKFVPRGAAPVGSVAATDLAIVDTKTGSRTTETRVQELDIPSQVSISFFDPNHDYQTSTVYARRAANPYKTMFSRNVLTQQFPIVAEPTQMQQTAEKILYTAWVERTNYKTKLPWHYLVYDPTDILTLNLTDDTTVISRTLGMSVGADLTLEMNSAAEAAATYSSTATSDGGLGFTQRSLVPPTGTKLFMLDSPLIRDIDDTGFTYTNLYYSAGGFRDNWSGAEFFKSSDANVWTDVGGIIPSSASTWGTVANVIGDTDVPFAIDDTNFIRVNMVTGAANLESVTLLQACNGANMCAVLNPQTGVLELIQFLTVTANMDGTYTLTDLLRGRRGTEVYTASHAPGENFILLSPSTVSAAKVTLSDMNVLRYFRAVTFGTAFDRANTVTIKDTGRAWKPYAPVHAAANASGANIALTWVRRTRVNGNLHDLTGTVPLSEQDEAYQVDIYDAGATTVLRTLSVDYASTTPTATPGVTYTAAQMNADFGIVPTSLNVAIYQMGTVGRGFGKIVNLPVIGTVSTTERFWGVSTLTSLTSAQVQALANHDLNTTFNLTTTYDCSPGGAGNYPYFCFPASYGTPSHVFVNGLPFSDFTVAVVSVTIAGVSTNYNVIRFNNLQHGSSIPTVWG